MVLFAFGADTNQNDPWSFKSPRTVRAKNEYDTALARAQAQAGDMQSAARAKLTKELEGAMTDATKAANLDEAVKIKAAIKELKEGGGTYTPNDLERRMANTRWRYNTVDLVFGNGIYAYSDWGGNHGTWKAIAGQTIVVTVYRAGKPVDCSTEFGRNVSADTLNVANH